MSPKNHPVVLVVIVTLMLGITTTSISAEDEKNVFIKFFQDHISAADGNRCSMHPSCSAYAAQAIEKNGMIIGWIMACDRLVRCGRDEVKISPHVRINTQDYVLDPVSANDFWWFTPPEKNTEPE